MRKIILTIILAICTFGLLAQDVGKKHQLSQYRYWFDTEATPRTVTYNDGIVSINASALDEGFHSLHYQVITDQGETSPTRTTSFYRLSPSGKGFKEYAIKNIRYWFDTEDTPRTATYNNGIASINASALDEGFHSLHYQVITDQGETSPTRTTSFYRLSPSGKGFKEYTVNKIRYWYDDKNDNAIESSINSGIAILNSSHLDEGSHTLHYQAIADNGMLSPVTSVNFERYIYDIYISENTTYNSAIIQATPLLQNKPQLKLHYQPNDLSVRGHLTVTEDARLSLGKYVQTGNMGYQNNNNKYNKQGIDYYHPTTLINQGFMRADSVQVKLSLYHDRWHFISLPFNTNVDKIEMPNDTYWALRQYDGEARAVGNMADTWSNLRNGDMMEAGKGYILQLTREGTDKNSWMTFKSINDIKKNNIFISNDTTIILEEHLAEFAHNRSWNLIGNPYPCFYDTRCIDIDGTITVWNGNGYSAYSTIDDNYILMPFEAFFIQKPLKADVLTFHKDGRQHTYEALPRMGSRILLANALQSRRILNFTLSDGMDNDHSRVVINKNASKDYETNKDASKFMVEYPQIPQLFSVESGVRYAINERPMDDGQITFSLYAPSDGEYFFSVESDSVGMTVLDTKTGKVWAMADGDYVFNATKGMHPARLIVSLTGNATAITQINTYDDGEIKVGDGQLSFNFIRDKHVNVFSIDGKKLFNDTTSHAIIKVSHGIYLIDIDGKITKIMVK